MSFNLQINKKKILYIVQIIVSVLIALEISIPPNPYIGELIFALTILICIKYNIPKKILDVIEKYFIKIKSFL